MHPHTPASRRPPEQDPCCPRQYCRVLLRKINSTIFLSLSADCTISGIVECIRMHLASCRPPEQDPGGPRQYGTPAVRPPASAQGEEVRVGEGLREEFDLGLEYCSAVLRGRHSTVFECVQEAAGERGTPQKVVCWGGPSWACRGPAGERDKGGGEKDKDRETQDNCPAKPVTTPGDRAAFVQRSRGKGGGMGPDQVTPMQVDKSIQLGSDLYLSRGAPIVAACLGRTAHRTRVPPEAEAAHAGGPRPLPGRPATPRLRQQPSCGAPGVRGQPCGTGGGLEGRGLPFVASAQCQGPKSVYSDAGAPLIVTPGGDAQGGAPGAGGGGGGAPFCARTGPRGMEGVSARPSRGGGKQRVGGRGRVCTSPRRRPIAPSMQPRPTTCRSSSSRPMPETPKVREPSKVSPYVL